MKRPATNRLSQYIKVAHNSFMTRGAAMMKGLMNADDGRVDLTAQLKAPVSDPAAPIAQVELTPASKPKVLDPDQRVERAPPQALDAILAPLTEAQVIQGVESILASTFPSKLPPEKQEALIAGGQRTIEALHNYEKSSGRAVLPTTKAKSAEQRIKEYAATSPDLERMMTNNGTLKAPLSPELKRVIGNTRPSLLSPADQQSLLHPRVVEMAANYQRASGYAVLPIDRAKIERKP
jgi:hypothetical protein